MDTKLNIHLQLPPDVAARVQTANARLDALEKSSIRFPPNTPHVTLLMGTTGADRTDAVLNAVQAWARTQPPLLLHLDRPSLPGSDGWVFLDAECVHGDLKQIRRSLAAATGTLIQPSGKGCPDTHSHLTLGLCDGPPAAGYEQLFVPEQALFSLVAVGHVGENGTVIDTLASFELCGD